MSNMWWYLSFIDDEKFVGGAVVEAACASETVIECYIRGIHPMTGRDPLVLPVPLDELARVPEDLRNRLLSKEELDSVWTCVTVAEWEQMKGAREA